MKRYFSWWIFFIALSSQAQNLTISARAVDKESGEPLPFASIGLRDQSVSTVTNLQGDFDFHIPGQMLNEMFTISMLGYENYEAPVWSLINKPGLVIEMTKSTLYLEEVVISDSLTGSDILQLALSQIERNYPMEPFLMDGFYRDLKKVSGTYVSLLESAVKIYDDDYSEPRNKFKLHERVALRAVRRSLGYSHKFTAYFDEDNLLEDLLLHNNVRYRSFPEENVFYANLKREQDTYYNGRSVYVVVNSHDYLLKVFVDKRTFGIIRLEYENNQLAIIGKRKGLVSKFAGVKRVIDFKSYEGKLFLNYLSVDSKVNWYDIKTDELQFETNLRQELLINEIHPNTSNRIGTTEKMKDYGLQYQDLPYDKDFWDRYNVIKESPLDQKIVQDLEKELPLKAQFEGDF